MDKKGSPKTPKKKGGKTATTPAKATTPKMDTSGELIWLCWYNMYRKTYKYKSHLSRQ